MSNFTTPASAANERDDQIHREYCAWLATFHLDAVAHLTAWNGFQAGRAITQPAAEPATRSHPTDEEIDSALESARDYIVEGFGYKYDEDALATAIRGLTARDRAPSTIVAYPGTNAELLASMERVRGELTDAGLAPSTDSAADADLDEIVKALKDELLDEFIEDGERDPAEKLANEQFQAGKMAGVAALKRKILASRSTLAIAAMQPKEDAL